MIIHKYLKSICLFLSNIDLFWLNYILHFRKGQAIGLTNSQVLPSMTKPTTNVIYSIFPPISLVFPSLL